jgi:hypothetical protein
LGGSSDTNQKKESGIFHLHSQNKNDEN